MNIFSFLGEVRSELSKVVWPTKKDVVKYTATVIIFSIAVSLILGLADLGILKLFEKVLTR